MSIVPYLPEGRGSSKAQYLELYEYFQPQQYTNPSNKGVLFFYRTVQKLNTVKLVKKI